MTFPSFHHLSKRVFWDFYDQYETFFPTLCDICRWSLDDNDITKMSAILYKKNIFFLYFRWLKSKGRLRAVSKSRMRHNVVTYKWLLPQMLLLLFPKSPWIVQSTVLFFRRRILNFFDFRVGCWMRFWGNFWMRFDFGLSALVCSLVVKSLIQWTV